ncbi:hypothetical protein ACET3X_007234 [Alternaria dauci]|uniref:Starter acyltransferase (SAT) domain-containing protein n=1 Tax=Alternaria dauci TaxID=48095 RepID=A0ABR3UCX0_9PLEO
MEESPGTWGWAILGIPAADLGKTLEQFQSSMGIHCSKRAKVGVIGDRWSTVIGPPSVLELTLSECPNLKNLPKDELNIHALQHTLSVSNFDIDYIVRNSPLLETPLPPGYRIHGLDEDFPEASYTEWRHLLRASAYQTLSRPLDIVQAVSNLNAARGASKDIEAKIIGPSSHTTYLAKCLQTAGKEVLIQNGFPANPQTSGTNDGIAIVGMAGKGPGSDDLEEF